MGLQSVAEAERKTVADTVVADTVAAGTVAAGTVAADKVEHHMIVLLGLA